MNFNWFEESALFTCKLPALSDAEAVPFLSAAPLAVAHACDPSLRLSARVELLADELSFGPKRDPLGRHAVIFWCSVRGEQLWHLQGYKKLAQTI